jgi:outer membrane protein OmpA-like peptidoglycan-associated protein
MSSQDNDQDIRVVAVVLISAILLAIGLALGFGISKALSGGASAPSMVAAPAAAGEAATAEPLVGGDASVVVESGVVKFYFASGKADLPSGALQALGDSVLAAQAGKRLVISGFHDATGDAASNAELAKQRAMAVRDALMGAGVAESSIELKKPEQTTGSGNAAEARRVEVMIAD